MSPEVQLSLVDNLPAILTALGIIITAYFTFRNGQKLETNTQATGAIKQSVDGAASSSVERIKSLEREIQLLREHKAEAKEDKALLAQAAALQTQPNSLPDAPQAAVPMEVTNQPLAVTSKVAE